MYSTGIPLVTKVAIFGGVATVGMGVATFAKHQEEMKSSEWLKAIRIRLNQHPGVRFLIGEPPVRIGILTRRDPSYEPPSREITPEPTHLVTVNVKGDKARGILYVWLNNPDKKEIQSVNDWNVAHMELQIGNNRKNKMPFSFV